MPIDSKSTKIIERYITFNIYENTKDIIAKRELEDKKASYFEVFKDASDFETIEVVIDDDIRQKLDNEGFKADYIEEITKVAIDKTAELVQEFKNNIDMISSNLELLIKDEKKASEEQAKAKAVLDLVEKKDKELNMKIWGEDKEDNPVEISDSESVAENDEE